mgnify:CR=1 FL=1|jgi:hypothetical protein
MTTTLKREREHNRVVQSVNPFNRLQGQYWFERNWSPLSKGSRYLAYRRARALVASYKGHPYKPFPAGPIGILP